MASRKSGKIEAQVVEAIRRLQAVQGSTAREISNYIAQEYNIPGPEIRRHVKLAVKRGVAYGILRRLKGGYYTYNQDFLNGFCLSGGDAAVVIPCKGRRGRRHRRRHGRSKRGRSKSHRRSRRRKKSGRRRRRRRGRSRRRGRRVRRRRTELPKKNDGFESAALSKPSRNDIVIGKERPPSDHSTVSGNSEERQFE